jgi:flagellar motility protein MotE (MotC chaperone)
LLNIAPARPTMYALGRLHRRALAVAVGATILAGVVPGEATSAENEASAPKDTQQDEIAPPPPAPEADLTPAERYCSSVQDEAALAQLLLQKREIEKAQDELQKRIAQLAEKSEEYKSWFKKREDFQRQANSSLVEIYAQMKPEAAAGRLTAMNELVAAAILSKLAPKSAGAVLAEMETMKAARLSSLLAGAADVGNKTGVAAEAQP